MAGPVVAAACVLDPKSIGKTRSKNKWHARVRDSKTIPEAEREILAKKIKQNALAYGVGVVSEKEIDKLNIHHASLLAMRRAVGKVIAKVSRQKKFLVLVDGRFKIPDIEAEQKAIIGGDAQVLSIAAASIIAKTRRDAIMREIDKRFPEYGFAKHKGYGTREHQRAIRKFGLSRVHRKMFIK